MWKNLYHFRYLKFVSEKIFKKDQLNIKFTEQADENLRDLHVLSRGFGLGNFTQFQKNRDKFNLSEAAQIQGKDIDINSVLDENRDIWEDEYLHGPNQRERADELNRLDTTDQDDIDSENIEKQALRDEEGDLEMHTNYDDQTIDYD